MKRFFSIIAASALAIAVCGDFACSMSDMERSTPTPKAEPTADATRDSMLFPTASPNVSPTVSDAPALSASPDLNIGSTHYPDISPNGSIEPNTTSGFDEIPGFMEGRVIDPSEIPDVTAIIGQQFPDHSIQAVTHEYYDGQQVYRVVLQGDGELSRVLFVYPSGNIFIPAASD